MALMQETQKPVPLEEKELRGLNLKNLIWLLGCTASIIIYMRSQYSEQHKELINLSTEINSIKIRKEDEVKYNELRIRTVEARIEALEAENRTFRELINSNSRAIKVR